MSTMFPMFRKPYTLRMISLILFLVATTLALPAPWANRVRDVHLVAFDLGVQFLERRDSFNRIARHSFGFPAFQPHALGNPHSLFAGAHQRFMRTSSGQSIAHSTTVVLMKMWTVSSLF